KVARITSKSLARKLNQRVSTRSWTNSKTESTCVPPIQTLPIHKVIPVLGPSARANLTTRRMPTNAIAASSYWMRTMISAHILAAKPRLTPSRPAHLAGRISSRHEAELIARGKQDRGRRVSGDAVPNQDIRPTIPSEEPDSRHDRQPQRWVRTLISLRDSNM